MTAAGICPGTPSYLAPERIRGGRYDARADLYSVGVLLYEMLSGIRPFAGTPARVARAHLHQPAPPLHNVCDVTPALEAVVMRALQKDPDDRFTDAPSMLAALASSARGAEEETTGVRVRAMQRGRLRRLIARLARRAGDNTPTLSGAGGG